MAAIFEAGNVRFLYPENWQLERDESVEGWSVAVQSPGTAFMFVSVYPERPPVKRVLDTTISALREDYPDLEAEDAVEQIAYHRAVGHDIQFFSMDLTNTCWVRSFRTPQVTVLILCQTSDLELDFVEPVFRAIRASFEMVEGETAVGD